MIFFFNLKQDMARAVTSPLTVVSIVLYQRFRSTFWKFRSSQSVFPASVNVHLAAKYSEQPMLEQLLKYVKVIIFVSMYTE